MPCLATCGCRNWESPNLLSPREPRADLETTKHQASLSGFLHSLFPLPGTLSTWLGPSSLLLVCSLGITVFWRFPWPLPAFPSLGSCISRAFPGGLCPPAHSTPFTASWWPGCSSFPHPHAGLGVQRGQRTRLAGSQLPPQSPAPA